MYLWNKNYVHWQTPQRIQSCKFTIDPLSPFEKKMKPFLLKKSFPTFPPLRTKYMHHWFKTIIVAFGFASVDFWVWCKLISIPTVTGIIIVWVSIYTVTRISSLVVPFPFLSRSQMFLKYAKQVFVRFFSLLACWVWRQCLVANRTSLTPFQLLVWRHNTFSEWAWRAPLVVQFLAPATVQTRYRKTWNV